MGGKIRTQRGPEERAAPAVANIKRNPSVRAGTDQAQTNEGARDGRAVRCAKCHVGTQSRGRWPCAHDGFSRISADAGSAARAQIKQRQETSTGCDTLTVGLLDL